jgi:hypothetical protein
LADPVTITFNFSPEHWEHVQGLGRMLGRWATLGGVPPEDFAFRDMLQSIKGVDPLLFQVVTLVLQGGAQSQGIDWQKTARAHPGFEPG